MRESEQVRKDASKQQPKSRKTEDGADTHEHKIKKKKE